MAKKFIGKPSLSGKCPISFGLDIFGDRWSLLIIRDMMLKGKRHYGDFLKSDEKISTNILASRLVRLEDQGIITKTQDTEKRSKFVYALTKKGEDLRPTLEAIMDWSAVYDT